MRPRGHRRRRTGAAPPCRRTSAQTAPVTRSETLSHGLHGLHGTRAAGCPVRPRHDGASPVRGRSDRDLVGDDADDPATLAGTELDVAGDQGEQRVVAAAADVQAGVEVRAALADEDLAGVDELTTEALHAEALSVGVAAVTAGGCTLFVGHVAPTSRSRCR